MLLLIWVNCSSPGEASRVAESAGFASLMVWLRCWRWWSFTSRTDILIYSLRLVLTQQSNNRYLVQCTYRISTLVRLRIGLSGISSADVGALHRARRCPE